MIGRYSFLRLDIPIRNPAQKLNESELMLRAVNLSSKESRSGAVFPSFCQEMKSIMRCSGCAPQDTRHQVWIVRSQFFHKPRSVISDLQKQRSSGPWNRCEQADDLVVDEIPDAFRPHGTRHVWVENLEKVTEPLLLGFSPEIPISFERPEVSLWIIVQRQRIQPQVASAPAILVAAAYTAALELL